MLDKALRADAGCWIRDDGYGVRDEALRAQLMIKINRFCN